MTRHKSVILIMILLLTLLTFASAGAEQVSKIRIQGPPTAGMLPLLWLDEQGSCQAGLLWRSSFPQIISGISLLASSDPDLLVTGVNVGAKAYTRGIDLHLLNVNIWGIDYLLTAGFQADSWRDLEGRSLCLPLQGRAPRLLSPLFSAEKRGGFGRS